jgi:hypothetical protein
VRRSIFHLALATLSILSLAACIDSSHPILTDSQPLFGRKLHLQLYTLRGGFASEPEQTLFVWDGKLYVHAGGDLRDVHAFSVHPFEGGDYIVQDIPANRPHINEFSVMHQLADSVYLLPVIDEEDADEATRSANCPGGDKYTCRIETREQLFALARATAAKHKNDGGLAIRLVDNP